MKPLAIVPTYLRRALDLEVCAKALRTLRATAGDACEILVVDDGSPARDLVNGLVAIVAGADVEGSLSLLPENGGFSRAVNIGLKRCQDEGRDAVLVNADIEFGLTRDWLGLMQRQRTSDGEQLASIVGALLLYPNGLIQHAGIFFSMLTRDFGHRFNFGPGDLPEAQTATTCPVTGALQFIRHTCLMSVGVYDPTFRLGWEDVDYCVRAWLGDHACVYQPGIRAIHHESFFRGRPDKKHARWTHESWQRFCAKYGDVSFAEFVPTTMVP